MFLRGFKFNNNVVIYLGLIILLLLVYLFSSCWNQQPSRYYGQQPTKQKFIHRDHRYYASLAKACDEILSETKHAPNKWVTQGHNKLIPSP